MQPTTEITIGRPHQSAELRLTDLGTDGISVCVVPDSSEPSINGLLLDSSQVAQLRAFLSRPIALQTPSLLPPATEMQFGRDDSPSQTLVSTFADGQVTITVQNTEVPGHACDNELTLGQAIQLRDFLNRHIDGLALAATGSNACRASDDPTQLAAEELLQAGLDAIAPAPLPMDDAARAVLRRKVAGVQVQLQDLFSRVDLELQLAGHPTEDNHHACAHPQRWLQSARMDVQTGLMKLERAVKNPAVW